MFKTMVWYWGKNVRKGSKSCARLVVIIRSNLCRVYKAGSFCQSSARFFRTLTHIKLVFFTGVNGGVLPTINTPNKDSNYLNKPYYY